MVLAHVPKPRQTAHDKKRQGQHHKQSKHYSKTYWPYLPMVLVVLSGFILNLTWNVGKSVLGYATSMSTGALLQETNIQRSQNGKSALSLNNHLSQAAQAKAEDMVARDYWSHVTPDGAQPWTFIANAGYSYTAAGENLAYGFDTSAAAVAGWMNSPSHRANLLNGTYQEVGFGFANASNFQGAGEQTVVVAMYATPLAAPAPQATQPKPATQPAQSAPAAQPAETPSAEQPAAQEAAPLTKQQSEETATIDKTEAEAPVTETLPAKEVSRIDILTNGNAQWAALVVSALATVSILALLFSHIKLWRRYLLKGERFIVRHPLFDTLILAVGVLGVVLTRTSGFIH